MTTQAIIHSPPSLGPGIGWAESGFLPDRLVRAGIRSLLRQRLRDIDADDAARAAVRLDAFVRHMDRAPVAPLPRKANEQHYEIPAAFFEQVLGPQRKYSACYWEPGTVGLEDAERRALELSCAHAALADGMDVLDLGCGWGSLSLWVATHYPGSRVTAVSNSSPQRRHIEREARQRGLQNLRVITCDMNDFQAPGRYDRVVSVEMFEHMRNYRELFGRISDWLRPGGQFFMHVFCHRNSPYPFEDAGPGDWMSRHFFTGGIMPSAALPLRFQDHLRLQRQWAWNGRHYARTANAWLGLLDRNRQAVRTLFREVYGPEVADLWIRRWRIFFMACAELFAYRDGQEWFVSHYRFARRAGGDN